MELHTGGVTFEEVRDWLARNPDLDDVFRQVFDADAGTGAWFQGIPTFGSDSILSSVGATIQTERSSSSVLSDLSSRGLLRVRRHDRRGDPQYELTADARDFELWRRGLPSPIEQVERAVVQLVDDAGFAERHPSAAKHLRTAFEMLSTRGLDLADTTIVGDHLRKALIDVAGAAANLQSPDENLERVLRRPRVAATERADAATAMLIDLTLAVIHLGHAIEHVRDEINEQRLPADFETMRRAAFLTAVCCYELDRTQFPTEP